MIQQPLLTRKLRTFPRWMMPSRLRTIHLCSHAPRLAPAARLRTLFDAAVPSIGMCTRRFSYNTDGTGTSTSDVKKITSAAKRLATPSPSQSMEGMTHLMPLRDIDGVLRDLLYLDSSSSSLPSSQNTRDRDRVSGGSRSQEQSAQSLDQQGGTGAAVIGTVGNSCDHGDSVVMSSSSGSSSSSSSSRNNTGTLKEKEKKEKKKNVLVILCGTAQSISTWSLHTRHLAKTRRVLIPELRAQGRTTALLVEHCTLAQHVQDLKQFLDRAVTWEEGADCRVDLVGFSLGGRIGLSFAEAHPAMVRSISVTGVPHQRPYLGQLILRSWLKGLQERDFSKTSWSFFENGVTPKFFQRNQRSLPRMVEDVMAANDAGRLQHLLEKALASGALGMSRSRSSGEDPEQDPDQAVSVSKGRLRLHCRAQVIASAEDRLAGGGSEQRLAAVINQHHRHRLPQHGQCRFDKILNCGHLAPFERAGEWRKLVLAFLDEGEEDAREAPAAAQQEEGDPPAPA